METTYEGLIQQLVTDLETDGAPGDVQKKLVTLNKQINDSINKLIKQTQHANTVNTRATGDASTHSQQLRIQLNELLAKKSAMDTLVAKKQTLHGQLSDRRRELDASYLHYIAWFISAITLGALAFNRLAKN